MFLIRSAEPRDFKAVLSLSRFLDSYNLPYDRQFVRALLRDSKLSFEGRPVSEERKRFLFVAEDLTTNRVVGCSLIIARHGTAEFPHIAFRIGKEQKRSKFLERSVGHETLKLSADRSGFTELGGLVLLPHSRHRKERLGLQLSYARFVYMAWHRSKFQDRLLVEYLPKLDPVKGNEFWNALGARFTKLTYREADRLSIRSKEFILSLFPPEKIYCDFLPEDVIQHLGVPGPGAQGSLSMLKKVGFRYLNQVDPFDGGPHYGADLRVVPLVRETHFYRYQGGIVTSSGGGRKGFVATVKKGKMKALFVSYRVKGDLPHLTSQVVETLRLSSGDRISITPLI